jgi:hypothetical protein
MNLIRLFSFVFAVSIILSSNAQAEIFPRKGIRSPITMKVFLGDADITTTKSLHQESNSLSPTAYDILEHNVLVDSLGDPAGSSLRYTADLAPLRTSLLTFSTDVVILPGVSKTAFIAMEQVDIRDPGGIPGQHMLFVTLDVDKNQIRLEELWRGLFTSKKVTLTPNFYSLKAGHRYTLVLTASSLSVLGAIDNYSASQGHGDGLFEYTMADINLNTVVPGGFGFRPLESNTTFYVGSKTGKARFLNEGIVLSPNL